MRKNKPLPIVRVHTRAFVHGGQAIGESTDGRTCFVWGALPGEIVEVQLTKKKKDWAEGFAVQIIQASVHRIAPKEPNIYLATSPWQILDYKEEGTAKQAILAETFQREHVAVEWQPFYQQENPYNYRNKMEYNFWYDTESKSVSLALHKRGSHQKVAVGESILASDAINSAGKELVDYINKHAIEARPLKSVILRSSADGVVGISLFVKDRSVAEHFLPYYNGRNYLEIVYSNPKSPASVATEVLLPAKGQLTDVLLTKKYTYTARSFFQVNVPVYEQVLTIIRDVVEKSGAKEVVDMYSGVGTIGLSVADNAEQLTMVETDEASIEQAHQNARGMSNVKIVRANAESALDYIVSAGILIVDPPRAGLHKDVVATIIEKMPQTVVYVSCNPSTQARDVKMLSESGFKIAYAQGFNFFPRTPHIENLIILTLN